MHHGPALEYNLARSVSTFSAVRTNWHMVIYESARSRLSAFGGFSRKIRGIGGKLPASRGFCSTPRHETKKYTCRTKLLKTSPRPRIFRAPSSIPLFPNLRREQLLRISPVHLGASLLLLSRLSFSCRPAARLAIDCSAAPSNNVENKTGIIAPSTTPLAPALTIADSDRASSA